MSNCFWCEKPEPCGCPLSSYGELPVEAKNPDALFPAVYLRADRAPFCNARVWLDIVNRLEGGKSA